MKEIKKKLDRLSGENTALTTIILTIVDCLDPTLKAHLFSEIDNGLEAARTALMNSTISDDEIEGFDATVQGIRYAKGNHGTAH